MWHSITLSAKCSILIASQTGAQSRFFVWNGNDPATTMTANRCFPFDCLGAVRALPQITIRKATLCHCGF
jgi:hypothetical protein